MPKAAKPSGLPKPRINLGLNPQIQSDADLNVALQWKGWIKHKLAALKLPFDAAVRALAVNLAKDKELKIAGEVVAIDAYEKQLDTAIIAYGHEHEKRLFPADARTQMFPAGSVGARLSPFKVGFIDPSATDEVVINQIIETSDLLPELDRIRAEFHECFPYLAIDVSLDRAGILNAVEAKTINAADLAKRGLKVERGESIITCKV